MLHLLETPASSAAVHPLPAAGAHLLKCTFFIFSHFIRYAWGVGVSRFRDNRHNASDIIGGFMLAITVGVSELGKLQGA